ncbi:hypothetical protein LTR08_001593 [Meristemomyces frigidus]|nr:hypothetical protein LTR08_001593 [Meristemomyces frigidus]
MGSLTNSKWAPGGSHHSLEPPTSKRTKNKVKATLKSTFRNSRQHTSEASPVEPAPRRQSTSQGPEAFNVFGTIKAGTGAKVIDVNEAMVAQYAPIVEAQQETLPPQAVEAPVDAVPSALEPEARRVSLSREHAELVMRMATLKQERDQAVEEAIACRAYVQSLLEKTAVLAPMLTLLEECRAIDAALNA